MRYIITILFALLFISCATTQLIHGVADVTDWQVTMENNEYKLLFYVHVGKDVNYYTADYYVDDQLLYSSKREVPRNWQTRDATQTVGIPEGIYVSAPTPLTIVITSYVGKEPFYNVDRKTFYYEIK